jgi:hypothetical protein
MVVSCYAYSNILSNALRGFQLGFAIALLIASVGLRKVLQKTAIATGIIIGISQIIMQYISIVWDLDSRTDCDAKVKSVYFFTLFSAASYWLFQAMMALSCRVS